MNVWTWVRKIPLQVFVLVGVVLLLVAGGIWWHKYSTDPERVFWATIDRSLRTDGVTIKAVQGGPNGYSVKQLMQYSLGAKNASRSLTTLTQGATTVVNEMIGVPGTDYTRYVNVKTDQKGKDGKSLKLSNILGVWAKSTDSTKLFPQAVLGTGLPIGGMVVPVAYMQPGLRSSLIRQIQSDNVYNVDFAHVMSKSVNGRKQYSYPVQIKPIAYARLMKTFAKDLGLHDLDQLDPNSFLGQQALSVNLTVDIYSHHVIRATLPKGNYSQDYLGYDIPVTTPLPTKTITTAELQQRLSQL